MNVNRRSFLVGTTAAGAAVLAAGNALADGRAASTDAAKPRKGRVYNGANGHPLAGVTVTDGLTCVQTDAKGGFELPYREEARFVSVTVPSGWKCATFFTALRQDRPRFDYPLYRDERSAGRGCTFIQLADVESNGPGGNVAQVADETRALAEETKAAFVVNSGDICGANGMRAHLMAINEMTMNRPVHYCVGNHDLVGADFGERLFEDLFGPCWYSFEAGGIHFCVTPMYYGDRPPKYSMDDAADWLKNDLALIPKTRPVILLGHMFCSYEDGPNAGCVFGDKRKIDLRKLCNYRGFIYGHLHDTIVRRVNGITLSCSTQPHCGGIDMSPGMVRAVIVDERGGITMKNRYRGTDLWKPVATDCVWERKLGAPVLYSTPLVKDALVYLATLDDEGLGTGAVYALDAESGAVVWRTQMENSVKNRLLFAAGNVVAADCEGRLVAMDPKTGKVKWRYQLPFRYTVMMSAPTLTPDGRTILVGLVRWMAAVDAETGRAKWVVDNRASDGVPQRFAVDDERVYGYSSWDGIYAFDLKTGREVWKIKDFGGCVYPGSDPLLCDGKLYSFLRRTIREIDPKTGRVLRQKQLPNPYEFGTVSGPVCVHGGRFILGTNRGGVTAIDRATLEPVWSTKNGPSMAVLTAYTGMTNNIGNVSPIVLKDGTLCAPAADGAVHFFSAADGRETRRISCGVPYCAGAAALDAQTVVVADLTGAVRAYRV